MKALITIIMGLALTACGGGGGGGGGGNSTPPPTQTTVPEEDTTQQEETTEEETTVTVEDVTMQDLVVPDDFSYNPVTEGTLNVDISGFSTQRAHLSVYKEFVENSSGNYDARYPSKVSSVPLNNGTANVDFNVSDSQGSLLVEIWFYDGSDPIQKVITSGDNTWTM
ncbi:hypothetical protein ACPV4X_08060 [Vibrio owensii]|uniref:hypothetical protein n=1 Tax=Vibrio owensii TaxID=696485 RepID=UPI0040683741